MVSDYFAIPELASRHHLAADPMGAAIKAFNAGVAIETPSGNTYALLKQAVESGRITQASLDQAVAGVLKPKFALGLFENPMWMRKGRCLCGL